MAPTPRLGLPTPGETDPADIPSDIAKLTAALDAGGSGSPAGGVAFDNQGTQSALPTAGVRGRYYFAVDTGILYRDTGTAWVAFAPGVAGFLTGDLKASAAATPPPGWLLCNGLAVLRATYPVLFGAIGVAYGGGDGSTTFNLPDYQGRVILGAGAGTSLTARALGDRGGEEAHLLGAYESGTNGYGVTGNENAYHQHGVSGTTDADSPDHGHYISDPGHAHTTYGRGDVARGTQPEFAYVAWGVAGGATGGAGTGIAVGGATARHSHTFYAASASQNAFHAHALTARNADYAHNNVQPYGTANMFIKT